MYGFVCICEGTNICMCEMRMQIRKSVSFLSLLFNSQWQGRVDNCERGWELFSIIIIIMRDVCVWSGGYVEKRHICRLHCAHVMRILEAKPQGYTGGERGGLLPMYAACTNTSITRPVYSSFLSLLYHVENSKNKNILVCKKASVFFYVRFSCSSSSGHGRQTSKRKQGLLDTFGPFQFIFPFRTVRKVGRK